MCLYIYEFRSIKIMFMLKIINKQEIKRLLRQQSKIYIGNVFESFRLFANQNYLYHKYVIN